MKICYLSKAFSELKGGIETYTSNMANYISSKGHSVSVVTSSFGTEKMALSDEITTLFVKGGDDIFRGSWILEKFIPIFNLNYSFKVAQILSRLYCTNSIDIVESPEWFAEGLIYSINKKTPLVVRLHGCRAVPNVYIYQNTPLTFYNKVFFAEMRYLLNRANVITSVSNHYADIISRYWGISRNKIRTIYNGIDLNIFNAEPSPQIEQLKPYVLYVGRIDSFKGVDVLCNAIPFVLKEYPELIFKFIGHDTIHPQHKISYKEYLLQTILKDIRMNVQFLDPIDNRELPNFYRNALISVFPSMCESFGIVLIEAMACGSPVIASQSGAFPEIVNNNQDGILFPKGDAKRLAGQIIHLLKDDSARQSFRNNGINKVKNNFSLNKVADETLDVYDRVLRRK